MHTRLSGNLRVFGEYANDEQQRDGPFRENVSELKGSIQFHCGMPLFRCENRVREGWIESQKLFKHSTILLSILAGAFSIFSPFYSSCIHVLECMHIGCLKKLRVQWGKGFIEMEIYTFRLRLRWSDDVDTNRKTEKSETYTNSRESVWIQH